MKKFNLDRLNAKMIKLGESPIKLKRTTYRGPIIKNEMLKGKDGSEVGTKGDMYVVFKVYTPKRLSREQKQLIQKLSETNMETDEIKRFNKFTRDNDD